MTTHEAKQRIEKLRKLIDHHRYLYHVLDKPEVSDAVDDSLKHELASLEKQFPNLVTPDSPTQRVGGAPLPHFKKVVHPIPILSIDDAFSIDELQDWQERNERLLGERIKGYYGELKMDGLAIVLKYEDGLFVQGATRGDGKMGEDVTQNLKTIESIPLRLRDDGKVKPPKELYIRGEVVIEKKELTRINADQKKRGEKEYANPRNLAAGTIRQLDPTVTRSRRMDFYAFEIIDHLNFHTHAEKHAAMRAFGFRVNSFCEELKDLKAAQDYIDRTQKKRAQLPYQTDGVVLVVNDIPQERRLGSVGKSERWMVAFKFAAEQAATRIRDIIIQVGRTGVLTPVALLDPVKVAGTTVARATLHNADQIKRLGVRIGDTVVIEKAGDIIPAVVKTFPELREGNEREFSMPKKCPVCGGSVGKREKNGVAHYCLNNECPAKHRESIYHFVSRAAFDIEGLGVKIVDLLHDQGLIRDAADIFTLKPDQLIGLEGFAALKANKLINSIQNKRTIPLPRFLYALGIFHVGEETAQDIANVISRKSSRFAREARRESGSRNLDGELLLSLLHQITLEEWQSVKDIGPIVALSLFDFFHDKKNVRLIEKLFKVGITVEPPAHHASQSLAGKTFVLTGTLSTLSREEAKEKIRSLGGETSETVSKKTSYVVAGENPGSKLEKAKKLDIRILIEQEFIKLLKS